MKYTKKVLSLVLSLSIISSASIPALANEKLGSDSVFSDSFVTINYAATTYSNNVDGFIKRLYDYVFKRSCSTSDLEYWRNKLVSGQMNAANVLRYFFSSKEFNAMQITDDQYVTMLYKIVFNRNPDATGKSYWLNKLKTQSRRDVLEGMIKSTEWANICLDYGVVSGTTVAPSKTKTPSAGITNFVKSMYTNVLKRNPDSSGLTYWTKELTYNRKSAKDVAKGFFLSTEFKNYYKTHKAADIVDIFYQVFFGRKADASGKAYWVGKINAGATVETVLDGFINSKEFANKCSSLGIIVDMPSSTPVYQETKTPTGVVIDTSVKKFPVQTANGTIYIKGHYDAQLSYQLYVLLNNHRKVNGIPQLKWDNNMRQGSDVRAVEIAYSISHVRPNGKAFNTVPYGNLIFGENIAGIGTGNAEYIFNKWKNSTGHNQNMLLPDFKSVSISVFVADPSDPYATKEGRYIYAVQNFSYYG